MSETVKVKVRAQAWSNINFDRKGEIDTGLDGEEWAALNADEQVRLIDELAQEWLLEDISIDYELPHADAPAPSYG